MGGLTSFVGELGGPSPCSSFFFFLYLRGWAGSSPIISSLGTERSERGLLLECSPSSEPLQTHIPLPLNLTSSRFLPPRLLTITP